MRTPLFLNIGHRCGWQSFTMFEKDLFFSIKRKMAYEVRIGFVTKQDAEEVRDAIKKKITDFNISIVKV